MAEVRTQARVWAASLLLGGLAHAHPVDEVVQGAYLTLTPGALKLELDITPGSAVSGGVLNTLDSNGDGQSTAAESRAFALNVLKQSTLKLDGKAVVWELEKVDIPPLELLKSGNAVLKIYAVSGRPDTAGTHTVSYQNRYQPALSQWTANIFLLPAGGWSYAVTSQQRSNDGRSLTVNYGVKR